MERQDAFQLGLIVVFFASLAMIDRYVVGVWHEILGVMAMGGIFVAFIAQEWILYFIATQYKCLVIILRPSNKILYLYHHMQTTHRIHGSLLDYATDLPLAYDTNYPPYGKVKDLAIHHELSWNDRVLYGPGTTKFKGFRIRHSHMARIECWEREFTGVEVKWLNPVPILDLYAGSGDYFLRYTMNPRLKFLGEDMSSADVETIVKIKNTLERKLQANWLLQGELKEVKRQARNYHQAAIQTSEQLEQVENEMSGMMKAKVDLGKRVIEEFLIERDIFGGIDQAIEQLVQPKFGLKFDWQIVSTTLIALAALAIVYFKWESIGTGAVWLISWLSLPGSQIFIGLMAVIVIVATYIARRRGTR